MAEKQTDLAPGNRARLRATIALGAFVALLVGLFVWRPDDFYLWIKALHVIAVMSWMAALLYMPRLFIYHTDAAPGSAQSETFKMMEMRLLTMASGWPRLSESPGSGVLGNSVGLRVEVRGLTGCVPCARQHTGTTGTGKQ